MSSQILDLLDAATDARIANPQLRPSVLAAMRLAGGNGLLGSGRLVVIRHDGEIREIISYGEASQSEEMDLDLARQVRDRHETVNQGEVSGYPLGKAPRIHGVLILEGASVEVGHLFADLFLQWCAMAEFVHIEKAELIDENYQLRSEIRREFSDRNIIAVSGTFRHVIESAVRVAASTATALIQGETGTGKELIARLIHDHSPRANGPFAPVNCGALSESLLESELFGHVKGAFTGAIADRKGRFEAANGGTIFLDEIGEISPSMQIRLLRVLQEMEVERVGDTRSRKLDVRVVAATNRVLEDEVKAGRFRADLYYRLNVVFLTIPPLRNRVEDIPPLIEHFLSRFCQRNSKYIERISREALEIMCRYAWPGNIRELENCIEKMVVMAPGRELTIDLLPMTLIASNPQPEADERQGAASFEVRLKNFFQTETLACKERGTNDLYEVMRNKWERYLFEAVLNACDNNKTRAAGVLGITRNTLAARLKELCDMKREWSVQ